MKISKPFLQLLVLFTVSCIATSCLNDSYTHQEYLVQVDSIHAPATVNANTAFDIAFYGTIGTNGCCNFGGFHQIITDTIVFIRVAGVYDDKEKTCPSVIVSLDGRKFNTTIPNKGRYTLHIVEPDNSTLEKKITVN